MSGHNPSALLNAEQYAYFFEHAPVGLVIVDQQGFFLRANDTFCVFVGYTEAELKKLRFLDITHPEDRPLTLGFLEQVGQESRAFINLEKRYLRKDGAVVWGHVTSNWFSEKQEGETLRFAHAVIRDITHRKKRENELNLFRHLINQGNDAISMVDPETAAFIYVNDKLCELSEYSQAELLTMTVMDLEVNLPDVEAWRKASQVIQKQGFLVMEGLVKKKGGSRVSVEVNAKLIQVESSQYLLAILRDLTERKVRDAQILQSQKLEAIGQLASGIAHEINTPVQFIENNTVFVRDGMAKLSPWIGLLKESLSASGEGSSALQDRVARAKESLKAIPVDFLMQEIPKALEETLEGITRVTRIVRAMKEFAHPGQEDKTLSDINKAVQNTLLVSQNEWKYVALAETRLDPDLPLVPCIPGEFNQALLNLIVNAAHAIDDVVEGGKKGRGKISISTMKKDGFVEIRIQDTGGGIPEVIRNKIFEPFFTTKPVGKGTGQGLSLARSIVVDKHGGNLFFETETGVGTTFVIQLPLEDKTTEDKTEGKEENPAS